jgi:hypothetical protein
MQDKKLTAEKLNPLSGALLDFETGQKKRLEQARKSSVRSLQVQKPRFVPGAP